MKTAGLQWVDQSAFDLRLRVFNGPLDRTCLTVLRETTLEHHGFAIWAAIIGSSHALDVTTADGGQLGELCSCQDAGRAREPLCNIRLCGSRHRSEADTGTLRYRFSSTTQAWSKGLKRAEEIRGAALGNGSSGEGGLLFAFPADGDRCPYTALMVTTSKEEARIETVHAYPNEENIVLTTSIFTRTEPDPGSSHRTTDPEGRKTVGRVKS